MVLKKIFRSITKGVTTSGKSLIRISLLLFCTTFFSTLSMAQTATSNQTDNHKINFPEAKNYAGAKIIHKIIESQDSTFGYDIYADDRMMIHQPSAPGLPGNEGFKTKAGAEKVAEFVISKIKTGEMPPTVTIEEMKKLKAIR